MTYYNCVLISEDEIKQKYPNLLKDGYTSTDIKTEITSWQERQRRVEGNSYKYDTIPSENEIYNRIKEKEQEYYNSPAYERGLQDILAKAPRDEQGRLLAPNGKPSNLTERQYAQVRTKAFKDWFGDWEKVANITEEELQTASLIFDRVPELAEIGTPAEYATYIKEIFPNSVEKEVYWHGSNEDFSKGFLSAKRGEGSGALETKKRNDLYLNKQGWASIQYVDGINRKGRDKNGFGHWNKLWWELKEIMSNGRRENNDWKNIVIDESTIRQAIPNKKGIFNRDSGGKNGKWLSERKADYGYENKSDKEFFEEIFGIKLGKDTFNTWTARNAEIFKSLEKSAKGINPVVIDVRNPIIEEGQNTYYEEQRGLFTIADAKGNDAILSKKADNEFNSDVAVVINANNNNVYWLGTKSDIKRFRQWKINNDASKVIDENGEPLVVYHGTTQDFTTFSKDKLGFFTHAASAKLAFFATSNENLAKDIYAALEDNEHFYKRMLAIDPNFNREDLGIVPEDDPKDEIYSEFINNYDDLKYEYKDVIEEADKLITYKSSTKEITISKALEWVEDKDISDYEKEGFIISDKQLADYKEGKEITISKPIKVSDGSTLEERISKLNTSRSKEYLKKLKELENIRDKELLKLEEELKHAYNSKVKALFLNIRNPKIDSDNGHKYREESYSKRIQKAINNNNDGGIIKDTRDPYLANIYYFFEPNQVKSATDNIGTFDKNNDNIYQEGERTSLKKFTIDKRLDALLQTQRERGTVSINYIIDLLSNSEYSGIINLLKTKKDGRTPLLSNISLKFIEGNQSGLFNKSRAFYDAKEKTIYVNTLAGYKDGKVDSVLLHEILHAITVNRIIGNKEFREEFDKIINEYLKHFYNSRYNKNSLDKEVAKHYMEEFIADVWSNPETIENLKKIKSDTKLSLWDKIKQFFIKIFKDSNGTLMSNASDAIYRLLDEPELTWNTENYYEGEQITEDKQIVYTPIGKTQQTYTVRRIGEGQYQIINKDGKEVFKEDSKDRRRIFANLAVKEKRAVVVTHKNKQYVVNNKGQIISVTTGDLMKWDDNNGVKKAILKEANEKLKNIQASSDNQIYNRIEEKKQILDKQEAKQWSRYSDNNYEVSSEGDGRFSAKFATFKKGTIIDDVDVEGKTIEYVYQSIIKKSRKGQAPAQTSRLNLNPTNVSEEKREVRKREVIGAYGNPVSYKTSEGVITVTFENGELEIIPFAGSIRDSEGTSLGNNDIKYFVGALKVVEDLAGGKEDFSYTEGYLPLWQEWAKQNPELIEELREKSKGKVLTDKFANTRVSQARALADILNSTQKNSQFNQEEPQQIPVYQTPTLEEDTRASVAFPNSIVRRDRVNLIKRLIYKGLSNEYSRQLEELDKRLAEVNQTKDKEESNKETLEILKAKADLTEEKAIEAGIGRVIKEVKEAFNIDNPNNSKQAERYLLRNNKKFNALSKEEQDKVIEQRVNKKHQNYRVILDNWNSLLDEALVLIHNEYGIKIDKSSEPEVEEEVGRDMYQFKARLEDMRSSLSKEVQKLISNVKHIKSDGKILKDDLGFAKYLNSDYVHMSLLNYLSKARNCQDFWRIFEKLAIKKPWVAELQKELEKNESLKSKFYQDFRKEFVPYWIEYDYETNSKTGQRVRKTKRINTIAPMYNTLEMWKDNIEGGITLNNVNIFNEDGSINKDNVEKVIETLETIFKEFRNAHNKSNLEGRDIVLEFIKNNEPKIQVIIESLGLEVDLDSLHETLIEKDSNIESILSNITSILKGINEGKLEGTNMKGEPIQLDFFDTFGGYAKNLTKVLNIVDKNGILKSFREQGNTYQSYSVPSYFGKLIENLKNGTPEEIREYIMNKFGKDRWFYNPKTETWNNSWLQSIYDNPTKFKEIIDRKVVLTSNKKSFNDWDDKQYALSMLSEFGIGESKNTAYYYLPVLADAESAEFIQFERIAGSDDTFKRTIREKLAKVVLQEYDRIQLVKQRKIDGAVSIDNFDRNGLKFNFIPELNTYEINGKLFIDALTESINKKNLESRDTIIDTALSTILEEGLTGFKTALNKSGVLVNTKDNRNVYYGLTNEGMNNELTNFYYNNALAQTQIIQLLTTDLAYYKNLNDFQKRFKEVYVMNRKLNTTSKYGRKFEKTLILVDEKRQAPSYDTIKEILDTGVENKRITEKDRNRILSLYKEINVTDAQAFRSLSSYRAVLDMAGRWTPQLEEAFERMEQAYKARLKGDKVTTFSVDDFYIILQTIKPFVYTVTTKSTGVKNTDDFGQYLLSPMQNKNSEFLLVNLMNTMVSALSNSGKLKAIERFMEDYQVDVVQFESAVKCGAQGKVDLSQFSDTDENGVYNYLKEISGLEEDRIYGNPDYITVIDYEDYGIQTENPEHLRDTKALFGTQLRKLIFEDIPTGITFKIDGKSYTKEKLWSLYNQLITVNVFNSYNDVAEEFSTIDGIAKLVSRQVKENPQMYSEELRKACELVDVKDERTGEVHKEFNIPIHEPTQRNRIESLLLSVIKNSVIKQKIKGASCVQVSCFGVSNDLKIVRTKEGGIKHIECYLPAYSKLFFEPFMKKNENGETYLDVNELPEDLRKCVGYRIPTEGLYSMQPLYIKGFLPIQNGSMIMLPAEITALTGSDFDIDKVFLMLPEFDSGTFIKKASLKWNFKKYLKNSLKKYTSKEDSYDEDFDNAYDKLEQIVKKDESKDILSTNLEKALYKFYEENKEKYTYPVRKVKYNFNKTLEENIQGKSVQRTTQIVNNALIDIIYGILTSPESAHKILDGGNFELAKCGDRICKIANNVTNLNKLAKLLHLEDNSSNSILAKLESMSSEQLDEILKDVETPLSPLSPVTNLYFHGQNANGGKMIGIYANSSVANAMFQMANVLLKTDVKKGAYPIVFNNEIFDVLGDMYDMNGRLISRNIKNFLAASVDNVKDPVLKGLMQSPTTGNLTCMLILAGVDINSVGLFLNQPLTKELITKLDADSNLNINDAIDLLLKAHGLEGKEISANSKQRYGQLLKEDLFKNIIHHNDEADLIFLTKFKEYYDKAKSYRKIVSVLRNDTKNNSIESSVAGCLKLLNNLNDFFNSSNKHFSVGNLISFVNKNREELQEVLNVVSESSVPFMSTFASFGIGSVMELMGPYTPFLNQSLWNIITDDEFGLSKLYVKDNIPDSFYESILNDYYLFILNQNDFYEHFDSNGNKMNEDESREYFIRKFPNEFRKLKNEIPELKNNQFIKKIIPVLPSKNDKFGKKKRDSFPFTVLKFQNSGSLSRIQEEQYSKDWFSLLTSDNPDIVKLGIDLFKYSTYFGFGFKPFSYMRMASVNIRKSIPKYLELINNQNNFDISSERNSIFIHSYLRNHAYDDNIVPTIIGSNLKSDKEGSIVLFRGNPSHRSIIETKLKTGFTVDDNKQYYDILRPMVKIKSEEGTFLYQISNPIIRQNENVALYPVTPLGYKGKIFEYNFNSYPKSVINKTPEVENIEIEDSLSDITVNNDDGRLDFKDISEYYDDFIGDSLEDFDSYETLDDEGNKVCDLSI